MKYEVFASYSRTDEKLVEPVTKLLDGVDKLTFLDRTDIVAGTKWKESIRVSLKSVRFVALFWCKHSSRSQPVREEYSAALRMKKRIIPVLLDSTKLPSALAKFQWVDFRDWADGTLHSKSLRTRAISYTYSSGRRLDELLCRDISLYDGDIYGGQSHTKPPSPVNLVISSSGAHTVHKRRGGKPVGEVPAQMALFLYDIVRKDGPDDLGRLSIPLEQ